ncbi:hypothetical protein GQ43DRAFT_382308 [Delitschia confertaspora ATCC 74209]|uniref:PHD-type domain-containing protein n=1 Tax=Delitschia confertaspora ATCC 74209 TaxID=1513339 RepID=A0A9P4JCN2_9PLEO|nr:hypothetical protein GQ43DRAFT_382308 [Delitschia confertaspora ATCC 74209]
MSLDQHIYGVTDRPLPSPSSTPKSGALPEAALRTPKADTSQSHFLDAWSTPRVNGHQTPAYTPSFSITIPVDRSLHSTSKVCTPEDPEFHVNHFTPSNLPLPPVDPSRRLSSSPGPLASNQSRSTMPRNPSSRLGPPMMDSSQTSQMQTPPPTRHATSRRSLHQDTENQLSTPVTVIRGTSVQAGDGLYNQTPFDFPSLQFSPDMIFPSSGPMSTPALPHSTLFWDQRLGGDRLDEGMSIASDPFGPTPHKVDNSIAWQAFGTPNQMNPQAFQALHGVPVSNPPVSFTMNHAAASKAKQNFRPSSFIPTNTGVNPSMLFSFTSSPSTESFEKQPHQNIKYQGRQPYETQFRDALEERELAKMAISQHTRTSTCSSNGSFHDPRPALQRSNTDSGFRKSRPSSMESRLSGSSSGQHIPRRSSPLKRQSGGTLGAIPEIRRPRTRLIVDENGRARTETIAVEDEEDQIESRRNSRNDPRLQYPGLWNEDDSESEEDQPTLSRNTSFSMSTRRSSSKHARADSGSLRPESPFKIVRPASGVFDKSSFDASRPVSRSTSRKPGDSAHRRFSMMDFPSSLAAMNESEDQDMPDSPGDALGALKKVVEGRQKRTEQYSQNALKAHNQRWAQATADFSQPTLHNQYDPFTNTFNGSPGNTTDTALTTPSTDRSSLSSDGTRCVCNSTDDGVPMIQCESCNKWLHMRCIGVNPQSLPSVYVCIFCTGNTPVARERRVRGPVPPPFESPLIHKSVFRQ